MTRDHILVIDDDPDTIEFLRIVFTVRGRDVTGARTGMEGLNLARQLQPDLIMVDIMMPDIDGYEVTRQLRADPATANIPIVILTARSSLADQTQGLEAGANRFVVKPVGISTLVEVANSMLAGRSSVTSPAQES
jgi:putative two-component system response regulator